MMNRNIPYYLTIVGLFILLKIGFTFADNNDLTFLLKPTVKVVELLTGSHAVFIAENGYYFEKINILVGKSCAGFDYFLLCLCVFSYLGLKYFHKPLHKILAIITSLIFSYLIAIFANSSRIFASIIVRNQTINFMSNQQYSIHETVGVITNLSFLILAYILIEKILKNKKYAKHT
jgi:exosortase K